jgi:hypothetical protein
MGGHNLYDGGTCMERHDFLPRTAPLDGGGARDLPPTTQVPFESIPTPRMEQAQNGGHYPCTEMSENGCHVSRSAPTGHGHDCGHNDSHGNGCTCGGCESTDHSFGVSGYPLAMVYAPRQAFQSLYEADEALMRGTLFHELDLPFGAVVRDSGCTCRTERREV